MLVYLYSGTWRELTKTIRPLFYKWILKEVYKENYITRQYLENKKLKKENLKKVYFIGEEKKIKDFLKNNSKFKEWK